MKRKQAYSETCRPSFMSFLASIPFFSKVFNYFKGSGLTSMTSGSQGAPSKYYQRNRAPRYRGVVRMGDLVGLSGQARYTRRHRWMRRDVFVAGNGITKAGVGEMDNVQKSRAVQCMLTAVRAHDARECRLDGALKRDYEFYRQTMPKNARKRLRKKLRRNYA